MTAKQTAGRIALALSLMFTGTAFAQGADGGSEMFKFSDVMAMKMIDKNKDGMVSKKEYMAMMEMAWDNNAKKMKIKGDKVTADQWKEIQRSLMSGAGG